MSGPELGRAPQRIALYGWDMDNKKWIPVQVDATGKLETTFE